MKFFSLIDQFGVNFYLTIKEGTVYKSVFGGIATLLIYLISAIYSIYIIAIWLDNQIIPKIQDLSGPIKSDIVINFEESPI